MSIEQAPTPGTEQESAIADEQLPQGSLARTMLDKLRALPYEKQREVLDFVEFLAQRIQPPQPPRSFIGLFADQGIHITEEDIDEARREMWGNFPRESA